MSKELIPYPNITPTSLKAIVELSKFLKGRVEPLDNPNCKYPAELKKAIRALARLEETPQILPETSAEEIDIVHESRALYQALKTAMKSLDKMETNEKVQIFRTATALMEKLLTLQEKAVALDNFTQFKDLVMNTLDRYLSPVQISEFVSDLESSSSKI